MCARVLRASRFYLLALAAAVALGGCGGPQGEPPIAVSAAGTQAPPEDRAEARLATDDVAYLSRLGLIRGHLRVGVELYGAGHVMHAQSHMKHPGDELYAALEEAFAARGSEGFSGELEALAAAVENEAETASVDAAYDALLGAIARAETHVAEGLTDDAAAQAAIVARLIETAAEEYGIGVADGRVTDVHEYQDAYGFTLVAGERARSAARRLDGAEREALMRIADEVDALSPMWPALVPAERVGTEPAELRSALERVEAAASRL